ncbi:DMT family transporter [Paenibacillus endoradicis]|uniref:DMT family transporter n=1 Tax=Paenibacillus endoradicis TaxID=2972487 RepID=UPI0021591994|nr:DMT family transporter [Paenibacillus endoradicis]MCR8655947.1 DMT family transporter [Paenibacillus endoradicis]MCR8658273.1 DMT family transporter [Paenibacillus endoradicis]
MTEKTKAYIAAVMYAFIIGLSFMFVKMTLTVANPLDTLAHRFTIAWIAATIFIIFKKRVIKIDWKDIFKILPLALLYPVIFFTLQVYGLAKTTSTEAGIIQAAIPIFTLVFASILLKEKTTSRHFLFIGLSIIGVIYLLLMSSTPTEVAGLIGGGLILLSTVAAALYNVFARKLTKQYSVFTLTYVMTSFGFIIFNVIAIGDHVVNDTLTQFFRPFMHYDFVVSILYLGILSSLITSYLSNYALSKIAASKMSVFSNFATLITILAGVLFLQEEFQLYHLIGTIIIVLGVIGTNFYGSRGKQNEKI